eukprot:TRINITY_DN28672_c0_g1_i1.p1 TRINITY_DN28672_c0_g1~~TRINITY_DN28672_c0_g1_i1.p1  ORF type:complete len:1958 (+),score=600.00 TRINITY_DN28672_c0_g1_i1:74-5947(+)
MTHAPTDELERLTERVHLSERRQRAEAEAAAEAAAALDEVAERLEKAVSLLAAEQKARREAEDECAALRARLDEVAAKAGNNETESSAREAELQQQLRAAEASHREHQAASGSVEEELSAELRQAECSALDEQRRRYDAEAVASRFAVELEAAQSELSEQRSQLQRSAEAAAQEAEQLRELLQAAEDGLRQRDEEIRTVQEALGSSERARAQSASLAERLSEAGAREMELRAELRSMSDAVAAEQERLRQQQQATAREDDRAAAAERRCGELSAAARQAEALRREAETRCELRAEEAAATQAAADAASQRDAARIQEVAVLRQQLSEADHRMARRQQEYAEDLLRAGEDVEKAKAEAANARAGAEAVRAELAERALAYDTQLKAVQSAAAERERLLVTQRDSVNERLAKSEGALELAKGEAEQTAADASRARTQAVEAERARAKSLRAAEVAWVQQAEHASQQQAKLQSELDGLRGELAAARQCAEAETSRRRECEQQFAELQATTASEQRAQRDTEDAIERRLLGLEGDLADAEKVRSATEKALQEALESGLQSAAQCRELDDKLRAASAELEREHDSAASLRRDLELTKSKLCESERRQADLEPVQAEVSALKVEIRALREKADSHAAEAEAREAAQAERESEHKELEQELASLRSEVLSLQRSAENEAAKSAELKSARCELETAEQEAEAELTRRQAAERTVAELQDELARQRERERSAERALQELSSDCEGLEHRNRQLSKELAALDSTVAARDSLEEQRDRLEQQLAVTEARCAQLEAVHEAGGAASGGFDARSEPEVSLNRKEAAQREAGLLAELESLKTELAAATATSRQLSLNGAEAARREAGLLAELESLRTELAGHLPDASRRKEAEAAQREAGLLAELQSLRAEVAAATAARQAQTHPSQAHGVEPASLGAESAAAAAVARRDQPEAPPHERADTTLPQLQGTDGLSAAQPSSQRAADAGAAAAGGLVSPSKVATGSTSEQMLLRQRLEDATREVEEEREAKRKLAQRLDRMRADAHANSIRRGAEPPQEQVANLQRELASALSEVEDEREQRIRLEAQLERPLAATEAGARAATGRVLLAAQSLQSAAGRLVEANGEIKRAGSWLRCTGDAGDELWQPDSASPLQSGKSEVPTELEDRVAAEAAALRAALEHHRSTGGGAAAGDALCDRQRRLLADAAESLRDAVANAAEELVRSREREREAHHGLSTAARELEEARRSRSPSGSRVDESEKVLEAQLRAEQARSERLASHIADLTAKFQRQEREREATAECNDTLRQELAAVSAAAARSEGLEKALGGEVEKSAKSEAARRLAETDAAGARRRLQQLEHSSSKQIAALRAELGKQEAEAARAASLGELLKAEVERSVRRGREVQAAAGEVAALRRVLADIGESDTIDGVRQLLESEVRKDSPVGPDPSAKPSQLYPTKQVAGKGGLLSPPRRGADSKHKGSCDDSLASLEECLLSVEQERDMLLRELKETATASRELGQVIEEASTQSPSVFAEDVPTDAIERDLAAQHEAVIAERNALIATLRELEAASRSEQQSAEMEALRDRNSKLEADAQVAADREAGLLADVSRYKDTVALIEGEAPGLVRRLEALEKGLHDAEADASSKEAALAAAELEIAGRSEEVRALQSQLAVADVGTESLREQLITALQRAAETEAAMRDLESRRDRSVPRSPTPPRKDPIQRSPRASVSPRRRRPPHLSPPPPILPNPPKQPQRPERMSPGPVTPKAPGGGGVHPVAAAWAWAADGDDSAETASASTELPQVPALAPPSAARSPVGRMIPLVPLSSIAAPVARTFPPPEAAPPPSPPPPPMPEVEAKAEHTPLPETPVGEVETSSNPPPRSESRESLPVRRSVSAEPSFAGGPQFARAAPRMPPRKRAATALPRRGSDKGAPARGSNKGAWLSLSLSGPPRADDAATRRRSARRRLRSNEVAG